MKVFKTRKSFEDWRRGISPKKSLGFVPTMGALHEGHLSLVRRSVEHNDLTLVSIFVNPTQFGPNEDYLKYPRTEGKDLALLKKTKVDAVFLPKSPAEIYPEAASTKVIPRKNLAEMMEGSYRPGHFDGVATVVLKLFQIVCPDHAYFGEKDFQQVRVIEAMVEDLFLKVKIKRCPIMRAKSGLALSSRNQYLNPTDQLQAAKIYKTLRQAPSIPEAKRQLVAEGFQLQYLECWEKDLAEPSKNDKGRWLTALVFRGVRLIDNVLRD